RACVPSSTKCFRSSRRQMRTSGWKQEISSAKSCCLLGRNSGLAAAQHIFLNLAGRGLRQLLDEGHRVRRLEMRKPLANELDQLAVRRRRAGLQDDEGVRRFAPLLVLHSN